MCRGTCGGRLLCSSCPTFGDTAHSLVFSEFSMYTYVQADTSAQARASAAGAECLPGSLARYHRRAAGARLLSLRDLASSSSADATAPESDLSHSNGDGSRPIRACQVGVSQTRKLLSSASGSTRHRQGQGDCNGKARYRAAQHGRGAGRSRADATGRGSDAPMAGGRRLWRR